jgi:hypothetical protein
MGVERWPEHHTPSRSKGMRVKHSCLLQVEELARDSCGVSPPAGAWERFAPPPRGRIKVGVRQATVSQRQRPTPILAFPLKGGRDCVWGTLSCSLCQ